MDSGNPGITIKTYVTDPGWLDWDEYIPAEDQDLWKQQLSRLVDSQNYLSPEYASLQINIQCLELD